MAAYSLGDPVHVAGFGKGLVREVRNAGRYLVEVKGRAMEVSAQQLSPVAGPGTDRSDRRPGRGGSSDPPRPAQNATRTAEPGDIQTLDLHGHTVDEALELLDAALNDALLAGARELRVIHGRSGGRIKVAVHRRLGQLPSVQVFRVDPRNPGVTIVVF